MLLFLIFFLFCSSFGKKKQQPKIGLNPQCSCQEHFKFPCVHSLVTACYMLSAEPSSIFPESLFSSAMKLPARASALCPYFHLPGARVMESIFHQTGSSFSLLSAAQPRAAKVDQASLVTWIQPSLKKRPLSFQEIPFHQQMRRKVGGTCGSSNMFKHHDIYHFYQLSCSWV